MRFVAAWVSGDEPRKINLTKRLLKEAADQVEETRGMASEGVLPQLYHTTLHEMAHVDAFTHERLGKNADWDAPSTDQYRRLWNEPHNGSPLISDYARTHIGEMEAEVRAEWWATGGQTDNPIVNDWATEFGWAVRNRRRWPQRCNPPMPTSTSRSPCSRRPRTVR